jgi:hypothetical protein
METEEPPALPRGYHHINAKIGSNHNYRGALANHWAGKAQIYIATF